VIKSKKARWARRVAFNRRDKCLQYFSWKTSREDKDQRVIQKWNVRIKEWIYLVQDMVHSRAHINAEKSTRVPYKAGNILKSYSVCFSEKLWLI
jgi:hypothetical protein